MAEVQATDAGRAVVLVGMMGSGKSTVGPLVAERLGRSFVDLDAEVEARTGRTVSDLFADGEEAFRDLESAVLVDVLALSPPAVVACGGGAILRDANRAVLRQRAHVVWLDARPEVLVTRVDAGGDRPLLAGAPDLLARVSALVHKRSPAYREVAHWVVEAGDREPAAVAAAVVAAVAPVVGEGAR